MVWGLLLFISTAGRPHSKCPDFRLQPATQLQQLDLNWLTHPFCHQSRGASILLSFITLLNVVA